MYALGVRSSNGVVLITDRKLTLDEGASQDFVDKIYGDIYGVLWAYAGAAGTFELFRSTVRDFVQANPKTTIDGFIIKLSEITHKIIEDFQYYFGQYEVLVAISGRKTSDGKSALKHIYDAGKIEPISKFKSIGGGAQYGSIYLQEFLREKKNDNHESGRGIRIFHNQIYRKISA
jgi:20S proteasome alpha/beta subunit